MPAKPDSLLDPYFRELKQFSQCCYLNVKKLDTGTPTAELHKAFSSAITRFFIYVAKHPELSDTSVQMLYYKLRLDVVARYFQEYPNADPDDLKGFQKELLRYAQVSQEMMSSANVRTHN